MKLAENIKKGFLSKNVFAQCNILSNNCKRLFITMIAEFLKYQNEQLGVFLNKKQQKWS